MLDFVLVNAAYPSSEAFLFYNRQYWYTYNPNEVSSYEVNRLCSTERHTFTSAPDSSSLDVISGSRFTSSARFILPVWIWKIFLFVFSSGYGNSIFLSIRPDKMRIFKRPETNPKIEKKFARDSATFTRKTCDNKMSFGDRARRQVFTHT